MDNLISSSPFVVAEVSKTYVDGAPVTPGLLSEAFERVCNVNAQRGYRLLQFSLHRLMTRPNELNETIVAVFEDGTRDYPAAWVDAILKRYPSHVDCPKCNTRCTPEEYAEGCPGCREDIQQELRFMDEIEEAAKAPGLP